MCHWLLPTTLRLRGHRHGLARLVPRAPARRIPFAFHPPNWSYRSHSSYPPFAVDLHSPAQQSVTPSALKPREHLSLGNASGSPAERLRHGARALGQGWNSGWHSVSIQDRESVRVNYPPRPAQVPARGPGTDRQVLQRERQEVIFKMPGTLNLENSKRGAKSDRLVVC